MPLLNPIKIPLHPFPPPPHQNLFLTPPPPSRPCLAISISAARPRTLTKRTATKRRRHPLAPSFHLPKTRSHFLSNLSTSNSAPSAVVEPGGSYLLHGSFSTFSSPHPRHLCLSKNCFPSSPLSPGSLSRLHFLPFSPICASAATAAAVVPASSPVISFSQSISCESSVGGGRSYNQRPLERIGNWRGVVVNPPPSPQKQSLSPTVTPRPQFPLFLLKIIVDILLRKIVISKDTLFFPFLLSPPPQACRTRLSGPCHLS